MSGVLDAAEQYAAAAKTVARLRFNGFTNAAIKSAIRNRQKKRAEMVQAIDTLRAQLEAAEADAARAQSQREHTQQWYAERMAKIEEIAKREGLWDEVAAVFANGAATRRLPDGSYFYDPPTYAQQLNMAKHKAAAAEARAEVAEAECERLLSALGTVADWDLPETGETWPGGGPVSYEAQYGSNGARDYMRAVARKAIDAARTKEQQA